MKKQIILLISFTIFTFVVSAQFNFIGRKLNPNTPKALPSSYFKLGDSIPKMDFKFDSIRPLDELKTGNGESYPWLSKDGNRIYYTEGISPSYIYIAEKKPGQYKFSNPHPLSVNSSDTSTWNESPWLTIDELNIYFVQLTKNGVYYLCHSKRDSINQEFSIPTHVTLIGKNIENIIGPSFTQDLETLYLSNSNYADIHSYIYVFNKSAEDEYTFSDTLNVPNPFQIAEGTLTEDDLNYFFNMGIGNYNPYYLYLFKKDSLNENFTKLYYINNPYINDLNYISEGTPYFSLSNNILAFTRSDDSISEIGNSFILYFAYNFKQNDNINENNNITISHKIFPNPTTKYLEILTSNINYYLDYYLTDMSGRIIISGSFKDYVILDLSKTKKGIFILQIIDKKEEQRGCYKIVKL